MKWIQGYVNGKHQASVEMCRKFKWFSIGLRSPVFMTSPSCLGLELEKIPAIASFLFMK